jgi:actin-related protein 6
MAPRTKSSGPPLPRKTLVLDNGAYTIKAGIVTPDAETPAPEIIPNCLARDRDKKVYIGSQLSACKDFSEIVFRRPVEKGYLVNWEAEKEIWEHEFFESKAKLQCDPSDTSLILTEAPNALPALQTNCDQVAFEEFGFTRYLRITGMSIANRVSKS